MKNYNISSESINNPYLVKLLTQLTTFFQSRATPFYVIGATARDLMLQHNQIKAVRMTRDLDIAIAIPDWAEYQKIEDELLALDGFKKDHQQRQRFIFMDSYELDIVPYGAIMKEQDKIFWPPDEEFAMSVLGFSEVDEAASEVAIDGNLKIKVASLAGIFILKISAWRDRNLNHSKDAEDMGFILCNYYSINEPRVLENHQDYYEDPNFSLNTAGARLLGVDMAAILKDSDEVKKKFIVFLESEYDLEEKSRLLNQIVETNKPIGYDEFHKCVKNIIDELKYN
ncbi:MAG TPA: nucleotidyl transferase AbiEii/AbiGii toxin family protein [Williamwhitmania sp.]|nr:nucleotidyl transferase AbiEii/AbiGii toxin family protein [Williamwhitmania sp.]